MTDMDIAVESADEYKARMERMKDDMEAAGVATEEAVQADYFGFDEHFKVDLPDGVSFVLHQSLNEGGRRAYMNRVNREVKITKGTGDAVMQMANGDERRILLEHAIVGWNLMTRNKIGEMTPVPFSKPKLNEFLEKANPKVVDVIDKDVRKHNDWLLGDVTLEDLLKQQDELQAMIDKKRAEEEGKES